MGKLSQMELFSLEGQFLGFVATGYKLKLMRLATATGECTIKLPKELRPLLYRTLTPGEWVQVTGYQKFDDGRIKLKAEQVLPAIHASRPALSLLQSISQESISQESISHSGFPSANFSPANSSKFSQVNQLAPQSVDFQVDVQPVDLETQRSGAVAGSTPTKPQTILVCQKSDCCKRGGNALVRTLRSELAERGLTEQVKICGTGCMKRCKAGPNLVMPDKTRYTRIQASEVSNLLDQHFPGSVEVAS